MSDSLAWTGIDSPPLASPLFSGELSIALSKFTTQKANGSRVDYADDAVGIAASIAGDGIFGFWGSWDIGDDSELATFHTRSAGMPCARRLALMHLYLHCRMPLYLFIT